ncbi:hypothetical protein VTH06DRAFT_3414 [Thermothelomyces fergusii]
MGAEGRGGRRKKCGAIGSLCGSRARNARRRETWRERKRRAPKWNRRGRRGCCWESCGGGMGKRNARQAGKGVVYIPGRRPAIRSRPRVREKRVRSRK